MPLPNPRIELPLFKQSATWALGERPADANGAAITECAPTKYGKEAWDDIAKYMPGYADKTTPNAERIKFAADGGVPEPDSTEPNGPPNYRPSMEPSASCGACKYFQQGLCTKYSSPVDQNYTCDGFEPKVDPMSMGGFSAEPVQPQMPLQPGQSMDIPGLDKASAFKYGFLLRCAEEGLDDDQIKERIELAEQILDKKAGFMLPALLTGGAAAGTAASGALNAAPLAIAGLGAAAMGAPYFLGKTVARGQHSSEKRRAENFLENNKVNIQDYQNLELINEYKRQMEDLKNSQRIVDRQNMPQSRSKSYF